MNIQLKIRGLFNNQIEIQAFIKFTCLALSLLPPLYIFSALLNLHDLPNNDYWDTMPRMLQSLQGNDGITNLLAALFTKSNEHIIAIPLLLQLINVYITNGSNTGLFIIAFLIKLVQAIFIYKIMRISIKKELIYPLLPIVSVLLFNPTAAHNWILSFSGTVWFLANTLVIIGLFILIKATKTEDNSVKMVLFSLAVILLATLSYSTAMFIFPSIILLLLLTRAKARIIIPFFISGITYFYLWANFYKTPSHHPEVSVDLINLSKFILIYIGGIFSKSVEVALNYGVAGLVLFFLVCTHLLIRRKKISAREIFPWLVLIMYSLLNGLASGMARGGFGIETALSGRYASLPSLFWLSLILILFIIASKYWDILNTKKVYFLVTYFFVIAMLIIPIYSVGKSTISALQRHYEYQKYAELSIFLGIYDSKLLNTTITPAFARDFTESKINILKSVNHIPFDKPLIPKFRLGEKIEPERLKKSEGLAGNIEQGIRLSGAQLKLSGWAYVTNREIDHILITNTDGIIRGAGILGIERQDVVQAIGLKDALGLGWLGYAKPEERDKGLVAYAKLKNQEELIKLNGIYKIQNDK